MSKMPVRPLRYSDHAAAGEPNPVDVFAAEHGLTDYLGQAVDLLLRTFAIDGGVELAVEQDPEEEAAVWIQVSGTVVATPAGLVSARAKFRRDLATIQPGVDQSLLRFDLGLREG